MTAITKPGLYAGLLFADYLADPCPQPSLSSSIALKIITHTPLHAHYAHPRLGAGDKDQAERADVGTVAHDLLLGGEGKIVVIDAENFRTKAAQEARDKAYAEGLTPVLADRLEDARKMVGVAREYVAGSEYAGVLVGESEQTVVVCVDGLWIRVRPDLIAAAGPWLHYKTTEGTVSPEDFVRGVMRRMNYPFVLAFYAHVAKLHYGFDVPQLILAQEQNAPHAACLYSLTPAKLALETARVLRAIATWRECLRTGVFPGYAGRVHYVEPTPWELAAAEEVA